ncbi:hypothetical protein, partial [Staphylococcus pseudintermedius]|uniref:hypothetical protein n=1 Tax=Staphylococcus pseudintermedius TaxID=283734 RepID=UPI001CA450A2
ASDFLQIPLRNGHPCLSLTVPTTKPVTDFHRQDVTHAGRTEKYRMSSLLEFILYFFSNIIDKGSLIKNRIIYDMLLPA